MKFAILLHPLASRLVPKTHYCAVIKVMSLSSSLFFVWDWQKWGWWYLQKDLISISKGQGRQQYLCSRLNVGRSSCVVVHSWSVFCLCGIASETRKKETLHCANTMHGPSEKCSSVHELAKTSLKHTKPKKTNKKIIIKVLTWIVNKNAITIKQFFRPTSFATVDCPRGFSFYF